MTIERFSKNTQYFFLSNMYTVPGGIEAEEGLRVPTAEHLYQAAKFTNQMDRLEVFAAPDGYEAKTAANRIAKEGASIRKDWEPWVKVEVMKEVLSTKFKPDSSLALQLIKTGEEKLEEGNGWGDRFWGISPPGSGIGMNMLGRLLMDRRERLRNQRIGKTVLETYAGAGKTQMVRLFLGPEDLKDTPQ